MSKIAFYYSPLPGSIALLLSLSGRMKFFTNVQKRNYTEEVRGRFDVKCPFLKIFFFEVRLIYENLYLFNMYNLMSLEVSIHS